MRALLAWSCPVGIEKSVQERKAPGWGDIMEGQNSSVLHGQGKAEDKDSGSLVQGRELVMSPLL